MYITSENFKIYKNLTREIFIKKNFTEKIELPIWTLIDYNFLSLITQALMLIVYLIFYNNIVNLSAEIDIINLTPSDYTLMISEFKNIPETNKEGDIRENIKNYLNTVIIIIFSLIFKKLL